MSYIFFNKVKNNNKVPTCMKKSYMRKNKPCKEVSKIDKFAVVLILDVNDSPSVLTTAYLLPVDKHIALRTHNGEWNHILIS